MYTIHPVVDPNTIHFGFYFLTVVFTIAAAVFYLLMEDSFESVKTRLQIIVPVYVILMLFTVYGSFIKFYPPPANTVVEADRVTIDERMGGGKYPSMEANVLYMTPDGIVAFPMGKGKPWPDRVILYKN